MSGTACCSRWRRDKPEPYSFITSYRYTPTACDYLIQRGYVCLLQSWLLNFPKQATFRQTKTHNFHQMTVVGGQKIKKIDFSCLKSASHQLWNSAVDQRDMMKTVNYIIPVWPQVCKYIISTPLTHQDVLNFTFIAFSLSVHLAVFHAASEDNPGVASCFSSVMSPSHQKIHA